MGRRTIFRIRKVLRVPHIITIPKIVTVERSPDSSTSFSALLTGFSSAMAVYGSLLSILDDPNDPHLSESERLETEARVHLRAIHREEAEDADSRRWFAQLRSRSNPPWQSSAKNQEVSKPGESDAGKSEADSSGEKKEATPST